MLELFKRLVEAIEFLVLWIGILIAFFIAFTISLP